MNLKAYKPVFIENSKLPVFLSIFAPIDIWAISFGFWVWCRGEMTTETKTHETIHFQQQLELLFVGQWVLYIFFYLKGLIQYRDGKTAYFQNPFEREAYANDKSEGYLLERRRFNWVNYIIKK
tara:strand:- start:472 stop:840 length:369 start_codon:yes stop_codon:yes gene_type:complete